MVDILSRFRDAARAFAAKPQTRLRGYGVQVVAGRYGRDLAYEHPETVVTVAQMRDMWRRDDQVRYGVTMRVQAALSTGGEIKPASDSDKDVEIAEFVTDAFDAMPGGIRAFHRGFARDRIVQGFAIWEKRLGSPVSEGRWRGKQFYSRLMGRSGATIRFYLDEPGEIIRIEQDPHTGKPPVEFTPDEVVYDVMDQMDGDPYGSSPLRAAYRYWYIKQDAIQFWARYLERLGMPIPVGSYPWREEIDASAVTANKKNREIMLEAFKHLRREMAIVKPEAWQIELLTPSHADNAALFRDLWHECDRGIARSLGLPRLLGETGESGGGSYSLGQEHADQFEWILQDDLDAIQDVTNEQIIAPLVRYNFGNVDLPKWKFNPFRSEDIKATVDMLDVVMAKAKVGKAWYYEKIGVPMPTEDDETIGGGSAQLPMPDVGNGPRATTDAPAPFETEDDEQHMAAATGGDALDRAYNIDSIDDDEEIAAQLAGENLTVIFEAERLSVEEREGKE